MSEGLIFDRLFGSGAHQVAIRGHFVRGQASLAGRRVEVIGTWDAAALDSALTLELAAAVLACVEAPRPPEEAPPPIVFIADTEGQALSRHEELLGLNGYFAHLARCVDLARRSGHQTLTLVNGQAVSGGFLAFGLLADRICALPGAQVRVMDLRAMARVTKIPFERLEVLASESPVFAPGAENYWRMGGIHEVWPDDRADWRPLLAEALAAIDASPAGDQRPQLGATRGGRLLAARIAERVALG